MKCLIFAAAALFAQAANAAEPPKPMTYEDGIVCHAVFVTELDMAAAAGIHTGGNSKADAYADFAEAAARKIGVSEGKSAAQIDADLAAALSETTKMAQDGEFDTPKPASTYFDVCVGILNRRGLDDL